MSFDSIKFGKVLWQDDNFTLCEVNTHEIEQSYIALVPTCLKLKKIIPSIPSTIQSVSQEITESLNEAGFFGKILESGITPDYNPFLVIKEPAGESVAKYAFVTEDEFVTVLRQVANALKKLHEFGIFQRELSPFFDVYFDGEKVHICFPAARDIFHKAYLGAGDNATVFDIPRFVIFSGSVFEDTNALVQFASTVLDLNKDILELDPDSNIKNYLEDIKISLVRQKNNAHLILDELSGLTSIPKINVELDYAPEIEKTEKSGDKKILNEFPSSVKLTPQFGGIKNTSFIQVLIRALLKVPRRYRKIFMTSGAITFSFIFLLSFIGKKDNSQTPSELKNHEALLIGTPAAHEVVNSNIKNVNEAIKVDKQFENTTMQAPKNLAKEEINSKVEEEVPLMDPEWRDNELSDEKFNSKNKTDDRVVVLDNPAQTKNKSKSDEKEEFPLNTKNEELEKNNIRSGDLADKNTKSHSPETESRSSEIVNLAKSTNFEDRIKAIKLLEVECKTTKERYIPYLDFLLTDADILVRGFAVHAYSFCLKEEAKPKLLERYKLEESSVVKRAIEKALKGL